MQIYTWSPAVGEMRSVSTPLSLIRLTGDDTPEGWIEEAKRVEEDRFGLHWHRKEKRALCLQSPYDRKTGLRGSIGPVPLWRHPGDAVGDGKYDNRTFWMDAGIKAAGEWMAEFRRLWHVAGLPEPTKIHMDSEDFPYIWDSRKYAELIDTAMRARPDMFEDAPEPYERGNLPSDDYFQWWNQKSKDSGHKAMHEVVGCTWRTDYSNYSFVGEIPIVAPVLYVKYAWSHYEKRGRSIGVRMSDMETVNQFAAELQQLIDGGRAPHDITPWIALPGSPYPKYKNHPDTKESVPISYNQVLWTMVHLKAYGIEECIIWHDERHFDGHGSQKNAGAWDDMYEILKKARVV